ncbi:Mo-nitrogenase MoFe protein subunit NifK [Natranaerovirga hydrolytica]|uniref:Nitrogenase molybdenum-iron protein beta chain n=1 Tax=Natranaerovirga hydrolytica TaxID=680378 RepID=A0A4R1MSJ8_9FIRM|nr:nitrogenase molybdenum-iron protein subunit beta [Natranaerovirga hydrolytica]TCK92903.1 Mo-nitrogenase MoFe protein subunit NifK [Natranaerovirga hydrolytica]
MLDYTTKEIKERSALVVNPAKTCQPIGAMYAALGINKCLPHSHGSQGCCSYHRMHLTRHYRDPIAASTSSFTEGACVFGGKSNLSKGLQTVFSVYNPDIVAVNTTCLSETIGDDLTEIIKSTDLPEDKVVIYANTPSYTGSHVTGFSNMTKAMVSSLAEKVLETPTTTVNVIPGYVEPSDMTEIKKMLKLLDMPSIMFPDTSGVVNAPNKGKYEMYPEGGVTIDELKATGDSVATVALGSFASEAAAFELEKKFDVEPYVLKTPIGIKATDEFLMTLLSLTGDVFIPEELEVERGQLLDVMIDVHHHYHGKKVAIFGDPDIIIALTEFVIDLGMIPKYVITGTPGKRFEREINEMFKAHGLEDECIVKAEEDLMTLHQLIKNEPVDILIGNTYGKYIARAEDIPLVRVGFPILDRVGHSYFPTVGYKGALRLIEKISTAILDKYDRICPEEDFELTM